MVQPTI